MKKATKIWLVVATSLVLVGCIFFVVLMSLLKWDFTKLSTVKYETNTYEVSQPFESISINTRTANIIFALSEDGNCRVECYEEEKAKHSVTVEEGVLNIELIDEITVHLGLNIGSPKITVYLAKTNYDSLFIDERTGNIEIPKDFGFNSVDITVSTGGVNFNASAAGAVSIKASTGKISVNNISAGSLDLKVSTGKVTVSGVTCTGEVTIGVSTGKTYLSDTRCKSVTSSGSTGDINLNNVIAAEKFYIERSTGAVKFDGSDAAEIYVRTHTGAVTGSLLSEKIFVAKTDTGRVNVPNSVKGGKCEITTDTGDINITIKN